MVASGPSGTRRPRTGRCPRSPASGPVELAHGADDRVEVLDPLRRRCRRAARPSASAASSKRGRRHLGVPTGCARRRPSSSTQLAEVVEQHLLRREGLRPVDRLERTSSCRGGSGRRPGSRGRCSRTRCHRPRRSCRGSPRRDPPGGAGAPRRCPTCRRRRWRCAGDGRERSRRRASPAHADRCCRAAALRAADESCRDQSHRRGTRTARTARPAPAPGAVGCLHRDTRRGRPQQGHAPRRPVPATDRRRGSGAAAGRGGGDHAGSSDRRSRGRRRPAARAGRHPPGRHVWLRRHR